MPKGDKKILKADIEDGFTIISNTLLVATALSKLSGLESRAMLFLWRQTYGWIGSNKEHKKEAKITLREWAGALNTCRTNAHKALKSLKTKRVIKQKSMGKGKSIVYATNTYIAEWSCVNKEMLAKQLNVVSPETDTSVSHMTDSLLAKPTTPLDSKSVIAKETIKENIKESILKKSSQLSSKKIDSLKESKIKTFELLKEKRGYDSPKAGIEAKAITWMLKHDYSVEDIMNAYQVMSKQPFWKDKELFMSSVQGQIGKIKKGSGGGLTKTEELAKSWK